MVRFLGCSGISWTACKQSAPSSRQITTLTLHHSFFSGRMLFLTPNQLKLEVKVSEYEKTGSRRQAATQGCLCRTHSPTGGQGENITPQDARRKQKKRNPTKKLKKMKLLKTEERASERNWRKWASVSAVILHGCPAVRCSFYVFIVCVRKC